jgi:hypothetical protein
VSGFAIQSTGIRAKTSGWAKASVAEDPAARSLDFRR